MRVYLDNAATTPIAPEVVEAMLPVLKETFGNPSSTHFYGLKGWKKNISLEKINKNLRS
jgi:cysteine desulfurase